MIGSYMYVLCVSSHRLITHMQMKKMSVMYGSVHVAITFQLLEMSSITTPNQTISNIHTKYIFQSFTSSILQISIMKKKQSWSFV